MADPKQPPSDPNEQINVARRRLLRTAIYVPPAVIGAVSLLEGCAPGSCTPNCTPN